MHPRDLTEISPAAASPSCPEPTPAAGRRGLSCTLVLWFLGFSLSVPFWPTFFYSGADALHIDPVSGALMDDFALFGATGAALVSHALTLFIALCLLGLVRFGLWLSPDFRPALPLYLGAQVWMLLLCHAIWFSGRIDPRILERVGLPRVTLLLWLGFSLAGLWFFRRERGKSRRVPDHQPPEADDQSRGAG